MTDEERKAVAEMTEKILAAAPRSLSGHDQDWDDAIEAAQRAATESVCKPRMFEYVFNAGSGVSRKTGRWKDVEQAPSAVEGR